MKLFDKKKQKFNLILTKQTAFAGIDFVLDHSKDSCWLLLLKG
jgi:hypothetical protein